MNAGLERLSTLALLIASVVVTYVSLTNRPTAAVPPPATEPVADEVYVDVKERLVSTGTTGVVLIEFSDYECPYCGRHARETHPKLQSDYIDPKRISYALINLPLPTHAYARKAAEAVACADAQGQFWSMHHRLFERQNALSHRDLLDHAQAISLDAEKFATCLEGEMSSRVSRDEGDAGRLSIRSTPMFFVGRLQDDGRARLLTRINGARPFEAFEGAIEAALARNVAQK